MTTPDEALISMDDILSARDRLDQSLHCVKTPMLQNVQDVYEVQNGIDLHIKLENTQVTGNRVSTFFKPLTVSLSLPVW